MSVLNTPSRKVKTLFELHQGQQIKKKKKSTTYAKPREGTDAFSLPENRKIVKKVNQTFFKDGVVRQKKAPRKNFIKKVVAWGFLLIMKEKKKKRESDGKKP